MIPRNMIRRLQLLDLFATRPQPSSHAKGRYATRSPRRFRFLLGISIARQTDNLYRSSHQLRHGKGMATVSKLGLEKSRGGIRATQRYDIRRVASLRCRSNARFEQLVAYRELSTPLTIKAFTGHWGGAIYGQANDPIDYSEINGPSRPRFATSFSPAAMSEPPESTAL